MTLDAQRRLGSTEVWVSTLGLGGAALGNLYAPVAESEAIATIETAHARGVSLFDTAPYYGYGLSEERMGRALESRQRESFVISTKVGRLLEARAGPPRADQGFVDAKRFDPVFDYGYDGVMRSLEASLERLGLDSVDVLLMHDLGALTHGAERHTALFEQAMQGGFRAMRRLRESGAVSAIGLGVNECDVCLEALERVELDCLLLAGRYTLLEQGALDRLLPLCVERSTSVIVGGPFNSGALVEAGRERHYDYGEAPPEIVTRVEGLRAICRAHGVPLAAAALQFPLHHPAVASVIPGARSPREMEMNVDWLALELPPALFEDLRDAGLLHPDAPIGGAAP